MRHFNRMMAAALATAACSAVGCHGPSATTSSASLASVRPASGDYRVRVESDGAIVVSRGKAGVSARFEPRFVVISADKDPQPALRWARFDDRKEEMFYNVMTWDRGGPTTQSVASDKAAAAATTQHVEDGYDPKSDRGVDANRTSNLFRAAPLVTLVGKAASKPDGSVEWTFDEQKEFTLRATVRLPASGGEPVLSVALSPKVGKYFSVGYVGAPAADYEDVKDLYQPMIWQERRWPATSVLTESFRAPVPSCLVTANGVTTGVVGDPKELPFQPLPTLANSTFGIALRDADGKARPMLFTPILGGPKSKMAAGATHEFAMRLFVDAGDTVAGFESLARGLYQLKDLRRNGPVTLNKTFENAVDYAMGPDAHFNEQLRGSAYDTDVPGAVKNVSALHPLGVALVTDNVEVYNRRARPMIEYAASRERFLFATDPNIKGQGTSTKLEGPGVPLTEMAALYDLSDRKSGALLKLAESVYPRTRILNLEGENIGAIWSNQLAFYKATGDKRWLDKAIAGADAYIESRVATEQTDFRDNLSRGMFFWTSYAPQFAELFDLYEITREPRHLAAAHESARRFAQFIWVCPVVPDEDVTVNQGGLAPAYRTSPASQPTRFPRIKIPEETVPAWRLSEIGLTSESSGTCKGHRAVFLASHAPWLLRIAEATGDAFLRDLARSAVIGRSASFPGYHINTARTTVYEKADFANRPLNELNSSTSLHYNHIWPHIAMLLDYLVSDAVTRSRGAIDFPSEYAEGYAYLQSNVYGGKPGTFYGDKDVSLWMPKGLVDTGHGELNYIAGRGNGKVYVALTNQSDREVTTTIALNESLLPPGSKATTARVWRENGKATREKVDCLRLPVTVAARGITAIAFDGIDARATFQPRVGGGSAWKVDQGKSEVGDARAIILNFGPTLTNAYVYSKLNNTVLKSATLHYKTGGGGEQSLVDESFPYEWSVPIDARASDFAWQIETTGVDGTVRTSAWSTLAK